MAIREHCSDKEHENSDTQGVSLATDPPKLDIYPQKPAI